MLIIFIFHIWAFIFSIIQKNLDLKKIGHGRGSLGGVFEKQKKDQEKHRIVVEDYNNGNNFFVCFFNIDYLHKKDK